MAEFLGACRLDGQGGVKGRNDSVFHRNLSNVDVPEPAGFC